MLMMMKDDDEDDGEGGDDDDDVDDVLLSCGEHSAMGTWRHLWWLEGDGYIAALVVGRQR